MWTGEWAVKLKGAMRVYPGPIDGVDEPHDVIRVAADLVGGCVHLNLVDGKLVWINKAEGDYMEPITIADFVAWIDQGGLA